jgi:hypothetical protein
LVRGEMGRRGSSARQRLWRRDGKLWDDGNSMHARGKAVRGFIGGVHDALRHSKGNGGDQTREDVRGM